MYSSTIPNNILEDVPYKQVLARHISKKLYKTKSTGRKFSNTTTNSITGMCRHSKFFKTPFPFAMLKSSLHNWQHLQKPPRDAATGSHARTPSLCNSHRELPH